MKIKEKKKVDALTDLKEKQLAIGVKDKSDDKNDQSKTSEIFADLIEKRKNIMNELYENVDMNKLYFKYEVPTKDVDFNKYYDYKQLFDKIKTQRIKFDCALMTQRVIIENK